MISSGIDGILAFFEQHSVIGMMNLQPHAEWLIYTLAVLDLALTYMFSVDNAKVQNFIMKALKYGFFLMVIQHFQDVANMLFKTFASAGSIAATGNANAVVLTPGAIWNKGFEMIGNLLDQVFTLNPFTSGFGLWFLTLIAIVFCAIATFQMVFQFLEMKIEFCIFSSVAIFFIPFTCASQLSFLFQRIVTGFFSSLIKIMVMYFMLALVQSEITKFVLMSEVDSVSLDTVNMALRFMVMGLIVARLPQFAASIMSGASSMGGSVGSFAKGMATGAVSGTIGGVGFAAGARQQFADRLQGGQTTAQALRGTSGAVLKDVANAAVGNPAKVWFAGYDRGRSKTLRRGNPFEGFKNNTPTPEERMQASIDVAKINTAGKTASK